VSVIQNFLLATPEGYQISRSVRLRSSASAYFSRTPAGAGNRKTWTWSGWVKRGDLTGDQRLFEAYAGTTSWSMIAFDATAQGLRFDHRVAGTIGYNAITSAIFRDPSAWYHIVTAVDTTLSTATDRVKLYVNGVLQTKATDVTTGGLNQDTYINFTNAHHIGRLGSGSQYLGGYLTEINFIDGQALDPSSFGETNPVTGVWQPKKYTGTYGTNGFYLNFSDNSAATAAAIGKDYSGNGNNWTPNNISVTAGVTYDSMLDVPTQWADGGNGRGNYAVANPLDRNSSGTVADGNLKWSAGAAQVCVRGTFAIPSSGKWYMECVVGSASSSVVGVSFGLATANVDLSSSSGATGLYQLYASANRQINLNNSTTGSVSGGFSANDVLQIAVDVDNSKMWLGVNNTWYNSTYTANGDPATGANATSTTSMVGLFPFSNVYSNSVNWNFGQRPFAYTPPTGFKALNTLNLPDATIKNGAQYMAATLWTGTGVARDINNTVNGVSFQPDLVWLKIRSSADSNGLFDSVRGAGKRLQSNDTGAEATTTAVQSAFLSNGFTVGIDSQSNGSGSTYVGWQWKEGATQGFDIVTYTGTGVARTVAHSLGVAPDMMIVKQRSGVQDWVVYHKSIGNTGALFLQATSATATSALYWNNTSPNSSSFTVGTGNGTNANTATFVAYLFAAVAGYSAFGSYTGNGSTDGPFVFLGFRARWIMYKRTDSTGQWNIIDTARNTFNQLDTLLRANLSNADETNAVYAQDITANGWKIRSTNVDINSSGATYIYAAFAENPLKFSLAR